MSQITQSLLITAIGMGLVFILIILLWGFMAALVVITNGWDFMAQADSGHTAGSQEKTEMTAGPALNKASIVAIAVAAALASAQKVLHITPSHSGRVSNWQAVTRANTLASISSIFNRKPRG
ncbi:MAG: hypothetical protein WCF08_04730 [Anaerolineaceae bacterium]